MSRDIGTAVMANVDDRNVRGLTNASGSVSRLYQYDSSHNE